MGRRHKKHTTLFARIMVRLTIPLLFLSVIFIAIELTNQLNMMTEFNRIESQIAFNSVKKVLDKEINAQSNAINIDVIKRKSEKLKSLYHLTDLQIFKLPDHTALIPEHDTGITSFDTQAMDTSLYQKELGRDLFVRLDKKSQVLIAYIPLKNSLEEIYIARAGFYLDNIMSALKQTRYTLAIVLFFILVTGVIIGQGLAQFIVRPIRLLNEATQEIALGNFDKRVSIRTGDEIELLANTFNHMAETVKEMKTRAEDANPLTQLPGNQGILHELRKRIHERQKFVVFHADLDRFKTFNDHYGLARGDEAIRKTADLLRDAVREKGAQDDFIGHQGGDDFMVITRPNHAKELAEHILHQFDAKVVRSLYTREDYEKGYTLEIDRRRLSETGEERLYQFPLLSISLAGISNSKRDFADYFDCMSAIVEVKKEVKKIITSAYVIRE